jgi:hypothetical protein
MELVLVSRHKDTKRGSVEVYQAVHPRPVLWSSLLPTYRKAIEDTTAFEEPLGILPYKDWLFLLYNRKSAAEDGMNMDQEALVRANLQ